MTSIGIKVYNICHSLEAFRNFTASLQFHTKKCNIITLYGIQKTLYDTVIREMKSLGYSCERYFIPNTQHESSYIMFSCDELCTRAVKNVMPFSKSTNIEGVIHYTISTTSHDNITMQYNIITVNFATTATTMKRMQCKELENYINDKCGVNSSTIIIANTNIYNYQESYEKILPENFNDSWLNKGTDRNEYNFNDNRFLRVWHTNYIKCTKYDNTNTIVDGCINSGIVDAEFIL